VPGIVYRSRDGLTAFERGRPAPTLNMRHTALSLDGEKLTVTMVGECPERIQRGCIELPRDWREWSLEYVARSRSL